jgi:dsDNA-specific endonuclease/ATPase MutS2
MKKGDKVEHIDQNISGIVKEIQENNVTILTPEGFKLSFPVDKLVLIGEDIELGLKKLNIIPKKESKKKKNLTKSSLPELDLHIEKLLPAQKNVSSQKILSIQLDEATKFLQNLRKSHHSEAVIIHGHGKNILKKALTKMLQEKGYVYYDASYAKYGGGAVRVRLKK